MSGRNTSRSTRTTSSRADYGEWRPRPELRGLVACVWERRATAAAPTRVLPDGCVDVVIRSDGEAFVAGPDTRPVVQDLPAGTTVTGLRLRTGVAGAALAVPALELRDQRPPLEEVWGRRAHELVERVVAARSPGERLTLLQSTAARRFTEAQLPDPLVLAAVARLGRPGARVAAIGHELGVSERELRRRFQRAVGYGPKLLDRVLRFQGFLSRAQQLRRGGDRWSAPNLARVAADLGYADQAHLTRTSRELTGLPPTRLLGDRRG